MKVCQMAAATPNDALSFVLVERLRKMFYREYTSMTIIFLKKTRCALAYHETWKQNSFVSLNTATANLK